MQPSTKKPVADRVVLCQRGSELAEFVSLLGELGISVEIHSGELPSPENLEGARLVVIAGQRLTEGKPPAIRLWPRTLAVVDDGSKTLSAHLNRIGVAMVIRRPIHPRALRLLLLHELYRGPERRVKKRVLIGHPIRAGVGLFKQNATLLELSRTGARIALANPPKVGTLIQFVLGKGLTNSKPIKIRAKVVRSIPPQNGTGRGESEVGLALLDPIELARPIQAILDRFAHGPATTGPGTRNTPATTSTSPRGLTTPRPNEPTAAVEPDRTRNLPVAKPASEPRSPLPPPAEPRRLPPSFQPTPAASTPDSSRPFGIPVEPGEPIETNLATEIEVLEPDFELDEEVPVESIDRRNSIRVPYEQRVVALDEQAARIVVGRNLCLGGMRIAPNPDLAVGDVLRLALHADSETEPLVLLAGVARDDGEDGLVLTFAALTAPQRERLVKILAASGDIQGSLDDGGDQGAPLFVGELLARVARGRNSTHSRSGFTLIELMIVVAIIGVISSVAIPLFGRYQLRSKTAEVGTNLGAVRVVQEAHFSEHGNYLPANAEPPLIPGQIPAPFDIVGTGYADLGWSPEGRVVE